jgi:hypothetical protein
LPNFKVELWRNDESLNVENYIDDNGFLRINEGSIRCVVSVDYDWTRSLSNKYLDFSYTNSIPLVFPEMVIKSSELLYEIAGVELVSDITDQYREFFLKNKFKFSSNNLWRNFKLWEFEGCNLIGIKVFYTDKHGNSGEQFFSNVNHVS